MARGTSLLSFVVARILLAVPMLLILLTAVFVILRILPGDPVLALWGGPYLLARPDPPVDFRGLAAVAAAERPMDERTSAVRCLSVRLQHRTVHRGQLNRGELGSFHQRNPTSPPSLSHVGPRPLRVLCQDGSGEHVAD